MCIEDDLLVGTRTNAKGHWESRSLFALNDRLLAEMGCSWWSPPTGELLATWEHQLGSERFDEARAVFDHAHPVEPWVWKDPRACLALGFWRRVLDRPLCGIVVFRNPLDVARSLERRDWMEREFCLALWMRYTRLLLEQAGGMPVMVSSYDDILEDPEAFSEDARRFLEGVGMQVAPGIDSPAVGQFIDPDLRHSTEETADLGATTDLYDLLRALAGVHASFDPPTLGEEDAWIDEQLTAFGPQWRDTWKVPGSQPRTPGHLLRALGRRVSSIVR